MFANSLSLKSYKLKLHYNYCYIKRNAKRPVVYNIYKPTCLYRDVTLTKHTIS